MALYFLLGLVVGVGVSVITFAHFYHQGAKPKPVYKIASILQKIDIVKHSLKSCKYAGDANYYSEKLAKLQDELGMTVAEARYKVAEHEKALKELYS